MAQIEAAVLSRAEALIAWVSAQPDLELVTPPQPDRHAGIVTFRRSDLDRSGHAALYRRLMAGGVICAYRAGGIRLSPHAYSDVEAFFPLWERLSGQMIL
jgi:selenocysteine lyase/cysteine desulfurase